MKKLESNFVKSVFEKHGYKMVGEYVSSQKPVLTLCPKQHEYAVNYHNFVGRNSRCSTCDAERQGRLQKTPYQKVLDRAAEIGLTLTVSQEDYERSHAKKPPITGICKCGTPRTMNWNHMAKTPCCLKCSGGRKKRRLSLEHVKRVIEDKGYLLVSKTYDGNKLKMTIYCKKHGFFEGTFNDIDQGHGCQTCGGINSYIEKEISQYISSISSEKIKLNGRKLLKGQELDVDIASKKLGIEFDGLYWHSEVVRRDSAKRNIEKLRRVRSVGYSFFAIFEDEWYDPIKKNIVKSMISSRIGICKKKIHARKTEVRNVPNRVAREFMNANHLDGHALCKRAIGLFHDDQLVMCITLRTSMSGIQEIARMASLTFTNVVGGASKLISRIEGPLMTYSNNRIGEGNVYKQLGFTEETLTKGPSYYYTDFKKRVWRAKCKKLSDVSLGSTEREQALNGAFSAHFGHSKPVYRIYDYGHKRWIRK